MLYLMRSQEVYVYVCLFVCLSAAAVGKPLGFQLHPSEPPSIFDRGLRFSHPREAGSFTSTSKCQKRGELRGNFI